MSSYTIKIGNGITVAGPDGTTIMNPITGITLNATFIDPTTGSGSGTSSIGDDGTLTINLTIPTGVTTEEIETLTASCIPTSEIGVANGVAGLDGNSNLIISGSIEAYAFRAFSTRAASFYEDPSAVYYLAIGSNADAYLAANHLRPFVDNTTPMGTSTYRWSQLYAGTTTVSTSDVTEKTLASAASPVSMDRLVEALSDLPTIAYQWTDSIAHKGKDTARFHVGHSAQAVRDALLVHGIDPAKVALWCRDALVEYHDVEKTIPAEPAVTETDPKSGEIKIVTPAKDEEVVMVSESRPVLDADGTPKYREGLRVDHVQAVLIESLRRKITTLEDRLLALETKIGQ